MMQDPEPMWHPDECDEREPMTVLDLGVLVLISFAIAYLAWQIARWAL